MTHQWNPADYAQHSSEQARWARELIDQLNLQPSETVLDIGCGDGKITALMAEQAAFVVGIDSSQAMIDYARVAHTAVSNLHFEVMDAAAIDLDRQFEVIFSNAALHWVPDHQAVLAGVKRHLKPGGRFLFQMGGEGNAATIIAEMDKVIENHPHWQIYFKDFEFPFAFYGVADYEQWLAEAGLYGKRVELVPKDMQHHGRESLQGWMRTTWLPYLNRIPEAERPAFMDAAADRYLAANPEDADGIVHVAMVRLEVEGRHR